MLINFEAWCVILWFSLCAGLAFQKGWKKLSGQSAMSVDLIVIMGICILNVYAQFFSLFYKVGAAANIILLVASMLITYLLRNEFKGLLLELRTKKIAFFLLVIILMLVMLVIGSTEPSFYDTKLYHGQAIRWIEDYGVVKGLGVLHNRLAYNSAFMCLQALFGYRYIFDVELHSVNAFLAFVFLVWAISTLGIWKKKKASISDVFKVLLVFFTVIMSIKNLSSPNTDYFALALMIYVLGKWFELIEAGKRDAASYTQLCFLLVYGVSLKLSVAAVVLLAVYPLVLLIREKNFKLMGVSVLIGLMIISPFLIRNVIISGYLIYPYAQIDLFDVDWKMPASQVIFDKQEICVWGRKLKDVAKYDWSFREWFPIWYAELTTMYRGILAISVISLPIAVIKMVYSLLKGTDREKTFQMAVVYIVEMIALAMWFSASPDIRYGAVFLLLVPMTLLGEMLLYICSKNVSVNMISAAAMLPLLISMAMYIKEADKNIVIPADYQTFKVNECQISGVTFYSPGKNDWTSYYSFPGITYVKRTELIVLRGDSLEDGFRMIDRNVNINTYGNEIQTQ